MILHYKFEYFSNNNFLLQSLKTCADEYKIKYKLSRNDEIIDLYVEDELDRLEEFANILSRNIPMSIFLRNVEVEHLESMPEVKNIEFSGFKLKTFCPSCLDEVENKNSENYKNPFIFCNKCGIDLGSDTLKLVEDDKEILKSSNLEYLKEVAKLLNNNKKVKIKTLSGEFVFYKLTKAFQYNKNILKLLSTNLSEISKVVKLSQQELEALLSVEKPVIETRLNLQYKHISKTNNVEIRCANDMILHLLGIELKEYGIDILVQSEEQDCDARLYFETSKEFEKIDILKIIAPPYSRNLVVKTNSYNKNLDEIYSKFNQDDKSQFMVLLSENNLFDKTILNFYCSAKNDNGATIYSPKYDGILEYFKYEIPNSIGDIFAKIQSNDIGKRLIENYRKSFPELYEGAKDKKIDKNKESITTLFSCVETILGFEDSLLNLAHQRVEQKGPRIDFKFFASSENKLYNKRFDYAKFVQSGISFKLAGVENGLIALGYIDSYIDFFSRSCDNLNDELGIDGVSFCGSLLSSKLILKLINKNIANNYKIYYNKDFPIEFEKCI